MAKICKKGYMEMTKKIYLQTLKSVLGPFSTTYIVTFCIRSLFFVYGENTKQTRIFFSDNGGNNIMKQFKVLLEFWFLL